MFRFSINLPIDIVILGFQFHVLGFEQPSYRSVIRNLEKQIDYKCLQPLLF